MNAVGPYFLCIGAQKAGTTWLYSNLKHISGVAMPPLKEIHYFDEIYKNEKSSLLSRFAAKEGMNQWWWKKQLIRSLKRIRQTKSIKNTIWYFKYFFMPRNYIWYKNLFSGSKDKISGDITPDYCILDKKMIASIYEQYPNLRIIYLIRNPVDRAWSALKMRYVKRRGYDMDKINEGLIEEYYEKFAAFNNIEWTIGNWTTYYPRDQFYIGIYDELVENPIVFFNKILSHLGLSPDYDTEKIQRVVFKGVSGQIPADLKLILYKKSIGQMKFLCQYLPGHLKKYPIQWMKDAETELGL